MKRRSIPLGIWGNALAALYGLVLVAQRHQDVFGWLILLGGSALVLVNFVFWRRGRRA